MVDIEELSEKIPIEEVKEAEKIYYPRIVEKPFIRKKKTLLEKVGRVLFYIPTLGKYGSGKDELEVNPDLKQPLLQLIKDDGYTDIIEGVRKGLFIINDKNGKQKGVLLSPNKLTTWNIKPYPKLWIAYENEMTPYPIDIYHDGEEFLSTIRTIETNRDLLKDQAKIISAKMWFWLAILGVILLGLYFGVKNGWLNSIFGVFK